MKHSLEQRPTLLLVDDEASNLQVLRHTLQHDYRLLFAKDGPTALELAQRERPHLILLDVMMPGMSGHDVCRALKQDPATQAIPVIFVTALADVFDALTSVRPYKRAWSVDDAVELIRSESGGHFDPRVVEAFLESLPEILQIKECWQDAPATENLLRA